MPTMISVLNFVSITAKKSAEKQNIKVEWAISWKIIPFLFMFDIAIDLALFASLK